MKYMLSNQDINFTTHHFLYGKYYTFSGTACTILKNSPLKQTTVAHQGPLVAI